MADVTFDPDDASTYERFSEETSVGGRIVLVRYPEGYRLRFHGETVWREGSRANDVTVTVSVDGGGNLAVHVRQLVEEATQRALAAYDEVLPARVAELNDDPRSQTRA